MFTRDKCSEPQAAGWAFDGTPARDALGWRPEVGLLEGLRRTVQAYREAGWLVASERPVLALQLRAPAFLARGLVSQPTPHAP